MYSYIRTLLAVLSIFLGTVVHAQVIKGVVKDFDGNALPGVSVLVEGTSNGTLTDGDGKYKLEMNNRPNSVLCFSMIGMKTIYQKVDGRVVVNVSMEEDRTFLNEVVVVGYQEVKRKDL